MRGPIRATGASPLRPVPRVPTADVKNASALRDLSQGVSLFCLEGQVWQIGPGPRPVERGCPTLAVALEGLT